MRVSEYLRLFLDHLCLYIGTNKCIASRAFMGILGDTRTHLRQVSGSRPSNLADGPIIFLNFCEHISLRSIQMIERKLMKLR